METEKRASLHLVCRPLELDIHQGGPGADGPWKATFTKVGDGKPAPGLSALGTGDPPGGPGADGPGKIPDGKTNSKVQHEEQEGKVGKQELVDSGGDNKSAFDEGHFCESGGVEGNELPVLVSVADGDCAAGLLLQGVGQVAEHSPDQSVFEATHVPERVLDHERQSFRAEDYRGRLLISRLRLQQEQDSAGERLRFFEAKILGLQAPCSHSISVQTDLDGRSEILVDKFRDKVAELQIAKANLEAECAALASAHAKGSAVLELQDERILHLEEDSKAKDHIIHLLKQRVVLDEELHEKEHNNKQARNALSRARAKARKQGHLP